MVAFLLALLLATLSVLAGGALPVPDAAVRLNEQGNAQLDAGAYAAAHAAYAAAAALAPRSTALRRNALLALVRAGRHAEAAAAGDALLAANATAAPGAALDGDARRPSLRYLVGAAHYNLGALYMSRAVVKYKAANELDDVTAASAMHAEGIATSLLARHHLERALEIDPTQRECIKALQQIAIQTDDIEAYRRLQQIEAALP